MEHRPVANKPAAHPQRLPANGQLSDPAHERPGLQTQRDGRVRWSALVLGSNNLCPTCLKLKCVACASEVDGLCVVLVNLETLRENVSAAR